MKTAPTKTVDVNSQSVVVNTLLVLIFLDMFAVGLIVPLLPYICEKLGIGNELFGLLGSTFQAAQLVGSLVMGSLSDTFSKKSVLLISFVGSAISYLLLGFAGSFFVVFMSRVIVGLVKQTMSISIAVLTELPNATDDLLPKRIGKLKASMSAGFIFGPVCGGILSRYGDEVPTIVAAIIFALSSIIVLFFLPNDTNKSPSHSTNTEKPSFSASIKNIKDSFMNPNTGRWLLILAASNLAFGFVRASIVFAFKERYQFTAEDNGYLMAYFGIASTIAQAVGIPIFYAYSTTANSQMLLGCLILTVAYLSEAFSANIYFSLFSIAIMFLGGGITSTTTTASFSQHLPKGKTGGGLGVCNALQSAVGVIAPTLNGILLRYDTSLPFICASCITLSIFLYIAISPIADKGEKAKKV